MDLQLFPLVSLVLGWVLRIVFVVTELLESLSMPPLPAFLVQLGVLGVLVLEHPLSVLTLVEGHFREALKGVFEVEAAFKQDALVLTDPNGLLVVACGRI